MGLIKKIKKPTEGGPLASLWEALTQTDDNTRAYAIFGIIGADKENELDASTLLNFLHIIVTMKEDPPMKDEIIELISSKLMEIGEEALPDLIQIQKESPKCKLIVNKVIYYINSSKKIDEFEDIMKKMSK